MNEIAIFEGAKGEIQVQLEKETVWLRQDQMAVLFGRERSVITRHIGNVFKEGELDEISNVQNMHIANSDKPVKSYSLDVIISVGYRVKSQQGVQFRQWATKLLNEHLTQGYTLNQQRFEHMVRQAHHERNTGRVLHKCFEMHVVSGFVRPELVEGSSVEGVVVDRFSLSQSATFGVAA